MAQAMFAGKKESINGGLSIKEMQRFLHIMEIVLSVSDRLIYLPTIKFIQQYMLDKNGQFVLDKDGNRIRIVRVVVAVLHKDDKFDVTDVSLSYAAGKELHEQGSAHIEVSSNTGNLYVSYSGNHTLNSVMAQLPIETGCESFVAPLCLAVDGEIEGYLELPLSKSFVEDSTTGKFVNTEWIKSLGEGAEVTLTKVTRQRLVRCSAPSKALLSKIEAAMQLYRASIDKK